MAAQYAPSQHHLNAQAAPNVLTSGSSSNAAQQLSDSEKQKQSWHYFGYPAFSQWMGSSNDFFILRRFATPAARYLLLLQHRIVKLETDLKMMDDDSVRQPLGNAGIDSFDHDVNPKREVVIDQIGELTKKYYDYVNAYSQVRQIPTAKGYHRDNLNHFFENHPDAIDPAEQHFRENEGDLFPIIAKKKSPVHLGLEYFHFLRDRFRVRQKEDRFNGEATFYTSDTGFELVTSIFIILIGLCLLFGPMWWLEYVDRDQPRMGIITGFAFIFAVLLFLAAGPRPFEVLAATAAYAAVLTVFIQNNGTLGMGGSRGTAQNPK